ncbi:MAG: Rab family GTPase [Candidatus Hodarchaeota archaeon]
MTPLKFKVIMVGQGEVGKTALCMRLTQGKFQADYTLTIGTSYFVHKVTAPKGEVLLQIWDFSGQEHFTSILGPFTKGAHGVLLVFDLANKTSLTTLEPFGLPFLHQHLPRLPIFLIGTKQDLEEEREAEDAQIEMLQETIPHLILYRSTSAKLDLNVSEAFQQIATYLADNQQL